MYIDLSMKIYVIVFLFNIYEMKIGIKAPHTK